jgi:hypothetical protein
LIALGVEQLALAGGQHHARGRLGAWTTWLIAAVVGVMPAGRTSAPSSAFTNVALAVVELAQHDQVEALALQLGDPRGAHVAGQRGHADRVGDVGQLAEPRGDLALGGLVVVEEQGRGHVAWLL